MNKKIIGILFIVIIIFLIITLVFPIPILHEGLAKAVSSPCGYVNFAWSEVRGECDCTGIKIDTSCDFCNDTGGSHGCIGIVNNKICYKNINGTETQIDCK